MKNLNVMELRLKVFLLKDIPVADLMGTESRFIDSALAQKSEWLEFHEKNCFKYYVFGGLWPLEKDGVYKREHIYTITIRTVDSHLACYFSKILQNHYTAEMKGLTIENRMIPKKMIDEIYTLTPVVLKTEHGYWRNEMRLDDYERLLFENAVKKYNRFTGKKIDEDFQLYTNITFLNRKPIGCKYKNIQLLGDKIKLKIADNNQAQEMAYFLIGAGVGENCSRGFAFCNYKWI